MRHGKLVTEEARRAKEDSDENAMLWQAAQEGKAQGKYYENDSEIKVLTLDEVTKRLREIRSKYELMEVWDNFDKARWSRLEWRAKRLGFNNPFFLAKGGAAS